MKKFNLFEYHNLINQENILLSYKGPVTDIILAEISRDIRSKFHSDSKVSRKIFSAFMELAQNILYYSAEKNEFGERQDPIGMIVITQTTDGYYLNTGNLVENQYVSELWEGCQIINTLDRDSLRKYKREQRSKSPKERSKGAGIGLIQVALTSNNPLEVEFKEINDSYSFFAIAVKIEG